MAAARVAAIALLLAVLSPALASPLAAPPPPACACPRIYLPVCGKNSQTFASECEAACSRIPVAHSGPCAAGATPVPPPAAQPAAKPPTQPAAKPPTQPAAKPPTQPVAKPPTQPAAPAAKPAVGGGGSPPARPACACPRIFQPVCSKSGKTFANDCTLKCAGEAAAYAGLCRQAAAPPTEAARAPAPASAQVPAGGGGTKPPWGADCVCPMVYQPVCGVDGRTYGNSCEARCRGVQVARSGDCSGATEESGPGPM